MPQRQPLFNNRELGLDPSDEENDDDDDDGETGRGGGTGRGVRVGTNAGGGGAAEEEAITFSPTRTDVEDSGSMTQLTLPTK